MENSFVVEEIKTRLDKYLAKQMPNISRSQIQRDIEGGFVEVNRELISESKFVVRLDDKVVYKITSDPFDKLMAGKLKVESLKATNTPLKVLYNNHGLIIIDKPAGLTVHPGAGFKGETLASALLYQFKDIHLVGEEHRPGIVHRLDKDTSGVMLVAANQEMYEFLKNAFVDHRIKKEYIALVKGRLGNHHGVIDIPIGRSKIDFRKYTAKNPIEAKDSLTEYQVLEYLSAAAEGPDLSALSSRPKGRSRGVDEYTLILVKLHTGRTHQIRVHFSSIGHPLVGDSLYGGKKVQFPGLNRQFLHAKKIEVRLPNNTWIEAESELPEDLREVLVNLNSKIVSSL